MGCWKTAKHVGTWAARTSWRTAQGHDSSGHTIRQLGNILLCAVALAVLLVISSVEQNPGPGVEAGNIVQVLCSDCDRNLTSETQCDTCGHWFHNSCGNVKGQMPNSGKWCCDRCRWDRLRLLEVKLHITLEQIEDLK
jgi:hypothetical protein